MRALIEWACCGAAQYSSAIEDTRVADDGVTEEIKAFIAKYLNSVEQLEVLLLLQRSAPKEWSGAELSKALYISPEASADRLLYFLDHKFLVVRETPEPLYRYQPASGDLDRIARDLARLYEERRVRVINLIYSSPIDHIKSFADAFKFRKDGE
jgi:hypothetical protein